MNALTFLDQIHIALLGKGCANPWNADQLATAIVNSMVGAPPPWAAGFAQPPVAAQVTKDTIIDIPNDVMIHEMLKRGFAVSKIPERKEVL